MYSRQPSEDREVFSLSQAHRSDTQLPAQHMEQKMFWQMWPFEMRKSLNETTLTAHQVMVARCKWHPGAEGSLLSEFGKNKKD